MAKTVLVSPISVVIHAVQHTTIPLLAFHQAAYFFEDEAGGIFSDDADIRTVGWLGPEPVALGCICDIGLDCSLWSAFSNTTFPPVINSTLLYAGSSGDTSQRAIGSVINMTEEADGRIPTSSTPLTH